MREKMGRGKMEAPTVGSSIVLLQERFKQLQRLKEMRQERQMKRLMLQEVDCHEFYTSNAAYPAMNPQQFTAVRGPQSFFQNHDVDTSLHL